MVSFGIRRALESAAMAAAFTLAVFASPHDATAAESNGADQALLEQIQEILSNDGPNSRELVAPLTNLGLLYREGDDYSFALATLERAVQVVRVNDGLYALEQVPLVRQLIRIEAERGNPSGASRVCWRCCGGTPTTCGPSRCCARSPASKWPCSAPC
jgi:hypothetical protein